MSEETITVPILKNILNSLAYRQGYRNFYEICNMSEKGKIFLKEITRLELTYKNNKKSFTVEKALEIAKEFSELILINNLEIETILELSKTDFAIPPVNQNLQPE